MDGCQRNRRQTTQAEVFESRDWCVEEKESLMSDIVEMSDML
jgi:hypothetical protein